MYPLSVKKSYYKRLVLLAWPAILEQLLITAVNYVDTAMVGKLGHEATAAVAINIPITWVVNGLVMGCSTGFSVQAAHAVGAQDEGKVRRIIRQSILAVCMLGVVFTLAGILLAPHIPRWLGAQDSILRDAQGYLLIYMSFVTAVIATAVFSAIYRCMGNTKLPMRVNTAANLMNIVLNFFMIYETRYISFYGVSVKVPGLGWGVKGAAAATAISLVLSSAILAAGFYTRKDQYKLRLKESYMPDSKIMREAVDLGMPLAMERLAMSSGQVLMTKVVSALGTVSLAANQVAVTAEAVCYLPAHGVAHAATALVGQSLGGGKKEDARQYGRAAVVTGFALACCTALYLVLTADLMAGLFVASGEAAALAARMLKIVAVSEPFLCAYLVSGGVLRGAGDSKYPMIVSLIGMWAVRIPIAPLLSIYFGLGLSGVWWAMVIDQVVKGVMCIWHVRRGQWLEKADLHFEKFHRSVTNQ